MISMCSASICYIVPRHVGDGGQTGLFREMTEMWHGSSSRLLTARWPDMNWILAIAAIAIPVGLLNAQERTVESQRYPRGAGALTLLHEMWDFSAENVYPASLTERFDSVTLGRLEDKLLSAGNPALADVLNPFLDSLGVSHTRLYDRRHQSYYLLRSIFSTHNLDEPKLYTVGVQLDDGDPGVIRAVLEGSPAAAAGVRRGDRIIAVNGAPFESLLQWQHAGSTRLTVETAGGRRDIELTPVRQGFHRALAQATVASHRVIECGNRRIGYLHLWSGTHPVFLDTLKGAVENAQNAELDGFILDLRDGYGGAWFEYLDPFFPNRNEYFVATHYSRGEPFTTRADLQHNPNAWNGPVAVIINDGTRSGKESLAFQFRKSGRAKLIGSTTAGAFTGGLGVFAERNVDYILYLSVRETRLDGTPVEGVGVSPDIVASEASGHDVPLSAALDHLACQIESR